jgi:hypothetical protein
MATSSGWRLIVVDDEETIPSWSFDAIVRDGAD